MILQALPIRVQHTLRETPSPTHVKQTTSSPLEHLQQLISSHLHVQSMVWRPHGLVTTLTVALVSHSTQHRI